MNATELRNSLMKLNDSELFEIIKYANIGRGKAASNPLPGNNTGLQVVSTTSADSKYKVLKNKIDNGRHVDTDEANWYNKVQFFKSITSEELVPELRDKSEKEVYKYIYGELMDNNLSEKFVKILTTYLTNYVISGEIKKPLCLVGNPGCGKTQIVKIIASVLRKSLYRSSPSRTDRSHGLKGEGTSYKSPDMGELFYGCYETKCLNPIFFFDEIDDSIKSENQLNFEAEFLTILDDEQMTVLDNFLALKFSLKHSLLIFALNDLSKISEPFKDRCIICQIPDVEYDRMTRIVTTYASSLARESETPIIFSGEELCKGIKTLNNNGIRSIRRMKDLTDIAFDLAKGKYYWSDSDTIVVTQEDFKNAIDTILGEKNTAKYKIGF